MKNRMETPKKQAMGASVRNKRRSRVFDNNHGLTIMPVKKTHTAEVSEPNEEIPFIKT